MITLSNNTIDEKDIDNLINWLKGMPRLSKGPLTLEYEEKFAKWIGTKYSVFCNSGSSANLLMLYSLIVSNKLKNKKIVVPALAWATDLAPVIQLGLEPILCDINLNNLAVGIDSLEKIFKEQKPACLLLVSILGFSPDIKSIYDLCEKYNVILLEDNCESFGTKYDNVKLGNFGLMSSYSTFFSHHLCTIEGGMVCTNDKEMYEFLLMTRSHGWSRDLSPEKQTELKEKHGISDFNNLYSFYVPGFNVRSTDLQAFIGIGQLDKADFVCEKRNENFNKLQDKIKNSYWKVKPEENSWTSSFCYPIIHPKRDEIVKALVSAGIETRPLVCGSMGKQPMYVERYGKLELKNANIVDDFGLYVPNNPYLSDADIDLICDTINKVINE